MVQPSDEQQTEPAADSSAAAEIVVGPLLRYVGTTTATVWVETSAATEVTILGHRARTFQVERHHYALVLLEGLEPASVIPYEVRLDGLRVWPLDDGRPTPAIHMREGERQARLVFGSCRIGAPERPPYSLPPSDDPQGVGVDALWAYSLRLQRGEAQWPDGLLLLGDQVYADLVPPQTAAFIRARRDVRKPPGEEVADFEEYTMLYRESWSDPEIRWLLSTVPTAMIFDDHDVHDDWNISESWVAEMRSLPWWEDRITGAFMAYWLYQHIGNLSPPELAEERLLAAVRQEEDAGPRLRAAAHRWDRESAASRWAYFRDFGRSRLLVIDSRAARVLVDGRREMIDEEEWDWIAEHARGSFDHLVVATTLPAFCPARHPSPRVVERSRLRRPLGISCGTDRRAGTSGRRPRALGGVRAVVHATCRSPALCKPRARGQSTVDDHDLERRRAHHLRRENRSRPRCRPESHQPGRLLSLPEPFDAC